MPFPILPAHLNPIKGSGRIRHHLPNTIDATYHQAHLGMVKVNDDIAYLPASKDRTMPVSQTTKVIKLMR